MLGPVVTCQNHPAREAVGICVHCGRRVCTECSTKVEGINHCSSCLAEQAGELGAGVASAARVSRPLLAVSAGVVWLVLLGVLAWLMLEVVLPERG
jgi:hypothetical protein